MRVLRFRGESGDLDMEEDGGLGTPPTVPVKYDAVRFETPQELKSGKI